MDDKQLATIISLWHAVRPKAETAFKHYLHLLAVRNDWNTDEVKALENSGISDGFLESFWHAQRTNWRSPIRGETLEDAVPADVLEAEVKQVARQSIYQHVEKINRLLKDMAPAMNVLDFFSVPSLSVIDYRKEALSVQVLASQSIKGRPEWDEFKQEILQKLEPCQCTPRTQQPCCSLSMTTVISIPGHRLLIPPIPPVYFRSFFTNLGAPVFRNPLGTPRWSPPPPFNLLPTPP
ncbi:uncharacterized protein EI90DRAFT_3134058 [Cantharellus anzutake]|uniref:uncharacterized protein n=1 Tax=Cantharellus anzutake TaxID=1750568 RepID=UPI001904E78E|nr:uncharacterized protein EI90DRAFT_3134058 [Cantharellus anzutake]KAF8317006.1 hypothetical protein EI90DRAFT_3134058 [Cantharellus anzutake]